MGSIIVTGSPGAGKTTVARQLAASRSPGVHLDSDAFWHMIQSGYVSPWLSESSHQNCVVLDAVAQAALAFDRGGYEVVIDGIVGPWFLDRFSDVYAAAGMPLNYVVLCASEETVLARVLSRQGQSAIDRETVTKMHAAFVDLGRWQGHAVETDRMDPKSVVARIRAMRDAGLLRV